MLFKQFKIENCFSYLLAPAWPPIQKGENGENSDRGESDATGARSALLIDPHRSLMTDYQELLAEYGLQLKWVIDTQTHLTHLSCSDLLKDVERTQIGMSETTLCARGEKRFHQGECFQLGGVDFQVLLTPGITTDALCLFAKLQGVNCLFAGNTLPQELTQVPLAQDTNAETWQKSLDFLKIHVPEGCFVFSTLGELLFTRVQFSEIQSLQKEIPKIVKASTTRGDPDRLRLRQLNEQVTVSNDENFPLTSLPNEPLSPVATIRVEKLFEKSDAVIIDVREPWEFELGHAPGSQNIPLSELVFSCDHLLSLPRLYFICLSGRRSELAVRTFEALGHQDSVNVEGGFHAWASKGLLVEKSRM